MLKFRSAGNLYRTCSIRDVLIEIWSVYEIQEVVNFHCVKPDPVINRLFHWDAGTFVISMKFSFAKFPFPYGLVCFVPCSSSFLAGYLLV